jgi:hypothetical protein
MRRGWFGPKRFGWGASPQTWEGWAITLAMVALLAAAIRWLRPVLEEGTGLPRDAVVLGIVAGWLFVFLGVIWLTYQRE